MSHQAWQVWAKRPEVEETLSQRASGQLGEMQCTRQLVKLIEEVYEPGMNILDVGCNVGHYLKGIRRIDPAVEYKGVDAYEHYIKQARQYHLDDPHATFELKDIMQPLFKENPYDIVYCCNVILHLPFFKAPVLNLIESTKHYCFIRTLLGPITTIVKRVDDNQFDKHGEPTDFIYENTYNAKYFLDFIHSLGCSAEIIDDEFDADVLNQEYAHLKQRDGTRILAGQQIDGNIVLQWKFLKIHKHA